MSYNIHHGEGLDGVLSLERIAKIIRDEKATVVGLQEVDRHYGERSNFQDQARELAKLLDFHYVYGANIDIEKKDQTKNQQYGNAILSLYPIKDSENISLTSFGNEPRGLQRVMIEVDGKQLYIFNTHFSLDSESKLEQTKEIIAITSNYQGPKVLVGDFNSEPDSTEIQMLLSSSDFEDCFVEVENNGTFLVDHTGIRIDYIFVSSQLDVLNRTVVQREGSDHLPIIAELKLKQ